MGLHMTLLPENLQTALSNLDEDFYAELERRRADTSSSSNVVRWRQGADPYGLDWAWLNPYEEQVNSAPGATTARSSSSRSSARRRWSPLIAAIAASLLLGLFLGRQFVSPQTFEVAMASGKANYVTQRGTESLEVTVSAPFKGYGTVISLDTENEAEVFPGWGDGDLDVPSNAPSEPVALADGTTRAVFVVTETPAAEPIRLWLEDESTEAAGPQDYKTLLENLERLLQTKGYRRIAAGSISTTNTP